MLRVVLILFVSATVVKGGSDSRYGDYSAAGMPHYNMEYESRIVAPIDEYTDRSPDAPAHLDYKYEEESSDIVKTLPVKNIDDELLPKLNAKGRRTMKVTDIDEGEIEARHAIVPKYKSSRRITKHRTRIKGDRIGRPSGRRMNYGRSRNGGVHLDDRNDFDVRKDPSHEGNIDYDNFEIRDTTLKIPRRKPRDRTISQETANRYESDNDEEINKIGETDVEPEELDASNDNRHLKKTERIRPVLSVIDKIKPKNDQEYEEYEEIDMKRVNRLKNRLPDLFRRTKASDPEPTSTRRMQEFSYRRANLYDMKPTPVGITKSPISVVNVIGLVTNQSTVTSKSIQTSTPTNTSGLSIAEKSRLSILKKAQRKESERNATTTKPAVLLQVTQRMQTIVMVEPHQPELLQRARQVFDDSPERVERAKKLMRRKLLAGAKSVHELADNWDDMISPEATTTRAASVAERELKAVLGHRQRKEIHVTLPSNFLPTTFPPHAVDPVLDDQWNSFIVSNSTQRLQYPLYITIVALINFLQYYKSTSHSITDSSTL